MPKSPLLFEVFTIKSFAQSENHDEEAKSFLEELMAILLSKIAQTGDLKSMASYIIANYIQSETQKCVKCSKQNSDLAEIRSVMTTQTEPTVTHTRSQTPLAIQMENQLGLQKKITPVESGLLSAISQKNKQVNFVEEDEAEVTSSEKVAKNVRAYKPQKELRAEQLLGPSRFDIDAQKATVEDTITIGAGAFKRSSLKTPKSASSRNNSTRHSKFENAYGSQLEV